MGILTNQGYEFVADDLYPWFFVVEGAASIAIGGAIFLGNPQERRATRPAATR